MDSTSLTTASVAESAYAKNRSAVNRSLGSCDLHRPWHCSVHPESPIFRFVTRHPLLRRPYSTSQLFFGYVNAMPKVIVTTESQGKIGHELTEDLISIGRASDNTIPIDDPSVSGRHAQLERSGETYRLKDLGSTNGTRVNGIPIKETILRFDDRIRFGGVEARFESDVTGSQPLPKIKEIGAAPADLSVAPVDFANASPFQRRAKHQDPGRTATLAVVAIAILAFLGSMVAVLTIHAPVL